MVGTTDVTMDVAFTVDWRPPSIDVGEMAYLCDVVKGILPEMNVCEGCCLEPFQQASALRRRCEQPRPRNAVLCRRIGCPEGRSALDQSFGR